jgi:uncharacterized protein YbjT (DUF2867 family)
LTRRPETARLPAGVEVVQGDLTDLASLPAALAGVSAVFLFPAPESGPGFVTAATAAGVSRVVMLSSAAVQDDVEQQPNMIAAYHAEVERAVEGSGLEWTLVRPGGFATNTLQWAPQIRSTEVVYGPFAGATTAPIHEADIAAVAVAALTTDGHAGAKYPITGPESLTQADQVKIIGEVIGRPLRYEEIPPEAAREQMAGRFPASVIDTLLSFYASSVGQPARRTDGVVEQVLGRPPKTFREWVIDHVDDFR